MLVTYLLQFIFAVIAVQLFKVSRSSFNARSCLAGQPESDNCRSACSQTRRMSRCLPRWSNSPPSNRSASPNQAPSGLSVSCCPVHSLFELGKFSKTLETFVKMFLIYLSPLLMAFIMNFMMWKSHNYEHTFSVASCCYLVIAYFRTFRDLERIGGRPLNVFS